MGGEDIGAGGGGDIGARDAAIGAGGDVIGVGAVTVAGAGAAVIGVGAVVTGAAATGAAVTTDKVTAGRHIESKSGLVGRLSRHALQRLLRAIVNRHWNGPPLIGVFCW
jgi:hypothetical protein